MIQEPLDLFIEDFEQMENENDICAPEKEKFNSAVVHATDWTTETIINQIDKGNIKLNPSFQRRDAWDKSRKSRFIESLILGLPIPQIVLAESKEKRGSYIVLDGKQRLLSIRQFSATDNDKQYNQLRLAGLEIREDLKDLALSDFKSSIEFADDLAAFENQPIRTIVIKNWPNEDFLYHVFLRLNTGSVELSPQELRQALHPGPFVTALDDRAINSLALKEILKIKNPDFRMRDTELLLRFLAFKNFLTDYKGSLKEFLDQCCLKLNANWSKVESTIDSQIIDFEASHAFVKTIFKNNYYRKWVGNAYESRFNRAIYDVMVLAFANENVRNSSKGHEEEIEKKFKVLCETDPNFKSSIETTTKSLTATQTRISKWNEALNQVIGEVLPVPKLEKNQIVF